MIGSFYWLDIIVVAVWGFYVWHSWGKGVFEAISEVVVWAALWMVVVFYVQPFAFYLVRAFGVDREWAPLISLLFMGSGVGVVAFLVMQPILSRLERQHFGFGWHLLGGILPTVLSGGMMVGMVLLVLAMYPLPAGQIGYLESSRLYTELALWLGWLLP